MHWLAKSILDKKQPIKLYFSITGGGTSAVSKLLEQGSCSDFFIGAQIPYSTESLRTFLIKNNCAQYEPDKSVCEDMAKAIALASYREIKAQRTFTQTDKSIGIGVTASLFKEGQRIGRQNHAYIAICDYNYYEKPMFVQHIEFVDPVSRLLQENVLSNEILNCVWNFLEGKEQQNRVVIRNT